MPALAAELVRLDVEVIVSPNETTTRAIQRATRSVPVVMVNSNLVVENGFVESHARPGGNITGLDIFPTIEIAAKAYQLLKLAVPNAKIAAALSNPKAPLSHLYGDQFLQKVATATGLTIVTVDLTRAEELSQALERVVASRADVLMVSGDEATTTVVIADIAAFAAKRKLVSIGTSATYISVGGLLYYGFDSAANLERAASYVDRILRGAKPAELPVEQPSKYELVLNTRTAKAMGLTLPPSFMLQVNRTI